MLIYTSVIMCIIVATMKLNIINYEYYLLLFFFIITKNGKCFQYKVIERTVQPIENTKQRSNDPLIAQNEQW